MNMNMNNMNNNNNNRNDNKSGGMKASWFCWEHYRAMKYWTSNEEAQVLLR